MKKAWNYLFQKFHGIWKGHEIIKLCIGPWKYHEIGCYNVFNVYEKAMKLQRLAWGRENTTKLSVINFSRYIKGPWNYKDEPGPWKKHEIIYYKNLMAYEKAMKSWSCALGHENTMKLPVTIFSMFMKRPWNYKDERGVRKIPWNYLLQYFQGVLKDNEIVKMSIPDLVSGPRGEGGGGEPGEGSDKRPPTLSNCYSLTSPVFTSKSMVKIFSFVSP